MCGDALLRGFTRTLFAQERIPARRLGAVLLFVALAGCQTAHEKNREASRGLTNKQRIALEVLRESQEKELLESVGKLRFRFGIPKNGTESQACPVSDCLVFDIEDGAETNGPQTFTVKYKFGGQAQFRPLPETKGAFIPPEVQMLLVSVQWCPGSCPKPAATAPPTCPDKTKAEGTAGDQQPQNPQGQDGSGCTIYVVFVRDLKAGEKHCCKNLDRNETNDENKNSAEGPHYLLPAFIFTKNYLKVSGAFLEKTKCPDYAVFVLNGDAINQFSPDEMPPKSDNQRTGSANDERQVQPEKDGCEARYSSRLVESQIGWRAVDHFEIDRYPSGEACHLYSKGQEEETLYVDRPGSTGTDSGQAADPDPGIDIGTSSDDRAGKDNGIDVAPSKVFDTYTLRQMLNNTASQLAAISGFSPASITGAYGALQGVTSENSYFSAQVTTLATPTVSSVVSSGGSGSNTLANTLTLNNGQTGSSTTITCPAGTLPSIGTSGVPNCVPLSIWNPGTAGTGGASTGAGNVNGGQSTVGTNQFNNTASLTSGYTGVQTSNQSNSVTTNSGGVAGAVAPVPVSTTPLTAPSNVAVSASDVLTEQVQLNSQITTLRLLLQGALSDQYLVKGSRAVGTRQQTTVGFGISLNPPQRFKHAVAEVKIWVESPDPRNPVSVMNLLPADKTYNVAKLTSHQNAFGAGVAIESVNVGASGGKSKSRLYLAKDTDTVALQFPADKPEQANGQEPVPRSAKEHVRDFFRPWGTWQTIDDACLEAVAPAREDNYVLFGWQFRPVLGADYVSAGERWVYAQLALPPGLGSQNAPRVRVQTRWREYDMKRQVVGAVYKASCTVSDNLSPITVISPLKVHQVYVDDMGGGVLKISAEGTFLSSAFSVYSGPNVIAPTTFDGTRIQFFGNASSLLMADDLKLVGEDGRTTALGMGFLGSAAECGILPIPTVTAIPRPDGNSLVEAKFSVGERYSLELDKQPHPLILIGSQVYGLHETPFVSDGDPCVLEASSPPRLTCTYHFLAPTDSLRAAQTFIIRDLAWQDFKRSGTIELGPSFTALALLGTKPADDTKCPPEKPTKCPATQPPLYTVTGLQFEKLRFGDESDEQKCKTEGCLKLFRGSKEFKLTADNFKVLSNTEAVLELSESSGDAKPPAAAAAAAKATAAKLPVYEYKSLNFVWHAPGDTQVAWSLDVPQEKKPSVTATPAILNVGDSTQIVFSGVDPVLNSVPPVTLTFDNVAVDGRTYKYEAAKKTLTVEITTAMTSKPGHKEMTLTGSVTGPDGKPQTKTIQLPFEVTKR